MPSAKIQEQSAEDLITVNRVHIIYTRPRHQEVQQNLPGNCPKCGMALEPKCLLSKRVKAQSYLILKDDFSGLYFSP